MPKIFELFGFPVNVRTDEVEEIRRSRKCPFMEAICDGGGNRYQTKIKLTEKEPLTRYFNSGISEVIPGVCSIQTEEDIWVVCPRRLFAAKSDSLEIPQINFALQSHEYNLLVSAGLPRGVNIGIWSEVVLNHQVNDAQINYHFDYIAAPLVETSLQQFLDSSNDLVDSTDEDLKNLVRLAKENGYYPRGQRKFADVSIPLPDLSNLFIFEIMTASTSGSNTGSQTDIRSAFRNAILTSDHKSPGINKRQVWGRMVTQLFAKTALAYQWGGKSIWIIQDSLLRNIELTTRLKTDSLSDNYQRNISLIVMDYVVNNLDGSQRIAVKINKQGDAGINFEGNNTFTDILLPKVVPPKIELLKGILRRRLSGIVNF
ncbi:MAG: hypothetical protein KA714_11700 [Limnoraphis sp. WC205]|jgi:hypothetical protein|nr:hypothetical protein [Limnoraphis sp. WC205]